MLEAPEGQIQTGQVPTSLRKPVQRMREGGRIAEQRQGGASDNGEKASLFQVNSHEPREFMQNVVKARC